MKPATLPHSVKFVYKVMWAGHKMQDLQREVHI